MAGKTKKQYNDNDKMAAFVRASANTIESAYHAGEIINIELFKVNWLMFARRTYEKLVTHYAKYASKEKRAYGVSFFVWATELTFMLKFFDSEGQLVLMQMVRQLIHDLNVYRYPELEPKDARHSDEAKAWRKAIFERDKYTCVECGAKGKLNAHHIEHWSKNATLRYELSNGVTLCVDCHALRHPKQANLIKKARYHKPSA